MSKTDEDKLREMIRNRRTFGVLSLHYLTFNVAIFFIWLLAYRGDFWPIWVMIGSCISLGVHASALSLMPKFVQEVVSKLSEVFPFLREDWEDKQYKRLTEGKTSKKKAKKA